MKVIEVDNVNGAYGQLRHMLVEQSERWRLVAPRGAETLEWDTPVATVYTNPQRRVLFDAVRDANPFFHLFEAIWIAAGRDDVGFLSEFLPSIADYSDNQRTFNAAYGWRMRRHFGIDQLTAVVDLLRAEPTTRRAFIILGEPTDLTRETKDVACNVALFFKIRDGRLTLMVANRSNDAVWGAYGANAVQFSFLQELVAAGVGVPMGTYTQVSDSFHVYPSTDKVERLLAQRQTEPDPYITGKVVPRDIVAPGISLERWLLDCRRWIALTSQGVPGIPPEMGNSFFDDIASPMLRAFRLHRNMKDTRSALVVLIASTNNAPRVDWIQAGVNWLSRRLPAEETRP